MLLINFFIIFKKTSMEEKEIYNDDDYIIEEDKPTYGQLIGRFRPKVAPKVEEEEKPRPVRIPRFGYEHDDAENLTNLVVHQKRGIRYHPNLTTKEGGVKYLKSRKLDPKKWKVFKGDYDEDPITPDNVIIFENDIPRIVDGYTLSGRRPDFLYRAPQWREKFVNYKGIKDDVKRKTSTAQLKHYLLTHTTPKSQTEESLDEFIENDDKKRKKDALHRLYLDTVPRKQRTETKQIAVKQMYEARGDIKKLPSIMLRELITRKINQIEQARGKKYGNRDYRDKDNIPMDKLYMIRFIFNDVENNYRAEKGIRDEDKKTKQNQFLEMYDQELPKKYGEEVYVKLFNEYPYRPYVPPPQIPQTGMLSQSGAHSVTDEGWGQYQQQKKWGDG
jgi:hypothetical protein